MHFSHASVAIDGLRERSRRVFVVLDRAELKFVAAAVRSAEASRFRRVAKGITRLGNGSLYPFLTLASAAVVDAPLQLTIASAASVMSSFTVYPLIKRVLARARPCDYDRALVGDAPVPLDRYSCPSGHAMTAAAHGVPLAVACPEAAPFVIALCVAMSWSRVALGHHYVSDVVLGTGLGAAVATTVLAFVY